MSMAANFNSLPVALMEIKDPNAVIKKQAPIAFVLIIIHIALMYLLASNKFFDILRW